MKRSPMPPPGRRVAVATASDRVLWAAALALGPAWAAAEVVPLPDQALGSVPGATSLQSATGDSVQTACRGMAPLNAAGNLSGLSQQLFFRCRELVQSVPGSELDANSLDLSADALNGALQQIATEEAAALGTQAVEVTGTRLGSILTRISAVRRGVTGFNFTVVDPRQGDTWIASSDVAPQTGGAAGGDGPFAGRLSGFANLMYGFGDKDGTDRENEFDYDSWGITAGLDYRLADELILGAAVSYSQLDADFDDTLFSVAGGSFDSDGWGLALYGIFDSDAFYVDGVVGYGQVDYDLERRVYYVPGPNPGSAITDTSPRAFDADASTDSDDWFASLGAGFDLARGALSYGPYARLTYYKSEIDGYQESGSGAEELALTVRDQEVESFTSTLGVRAQYAMSRSFGVVIPQARLEWIHEFDNDSREISATYTYDPNSTLLFARTDDPDRDYAVLGLGVSAVMTQGQQLFADYRTVLGFRDLSEHVFTVGYRAEF